MDKTYAYILLPVEVIFKISKEKKENKDIYIYIYIYIAKEGIIFFIGCKHSNNISYKNFLIRKIIK